MSLGRLVITLDVDTGFLAYNFGSSSTVVGRSGFAPQFLGMPGPPTQPWRAESSRAATASSRAGLGGFVPQGRSWVPEARANQYLEVGDPIGYILHAGRLHEPLVGLEEDLKQVLSKKVMVADWIPSASVRKSNRPPVRKSIVIAQDRPYFVKRLRASADSD